MNALINTRIAQFAAAHVRLNKNERAELAAAAKAYWAANQDMDKLIKFMNKEAKRISVR